MEQGGIENGYIYEYGDFSICRLSYREEKMGGTHQWYYSMYKYSNDNKLSLILDYSTYVYRNKDYDNYDSGFFYKIID